MDADGMDEVMVMGVKMDDVSKVWERHVDDVDEKWVKGTEVGNVD